MMMMITNEMIKDIVTAWRKRRTRDKEISTTWPAGADWNVNGAGNGGHRQGARKDR